MVPKQILGVVLSVSLGLLTTAVADEPAATREVKVGEVVLSVPASWKEEEPANRLRLGQFAIPAAEGDTEPAELSVFNFGGGGSAQQQIERWQGQFNPQGRKFDAKQGKAVHGEYVWVDLAGTYKQSVGPPILRQTKDVPGSRMLVVMLAVKDQGNYFLKLVGPEKTVSAQVDAFRKSFGGDADTEKPFDAAGEAE